MLLVYVIFVECASLSPLFYYPAFSLCAVYCVTFLGILISCMSDVAFYYLRLDRYSISVGLFWLHVRCHT